MAAGRPGFAAMAAVNRPGGSSPAEGGGDGGAMDAMKVSDMSRMVN